MMNTVFSVAVAGAILLATTAAYSQEPNQGPRVSARESLVAPSLSIGVAGQSGRRTPPLFTFHGVEVRAWAPVPPPYNTLVNRNLAASPI